MHVNKRLWDAGIEAAFMYRQKPKPQKQFEAAERSGCPLSVILGQEEYAKGEVKVKVLGQGDQADPGVDVKLEDLTSYVKKTLSSLNVESLNLN